MKQVTLLISLVGLAGALSAQPSLRITSPADGTTVHPGDTLGVTLEVSRPEAFQIVFVAGFEPIGFSKEKRDKPPFEFTLEIPKQIRPDRYAVTALGRAGSDLFSKSIEILVERTESPIRLDVYPFIADFTMDQKRYFSVTGRYADRTEADLSQSSRIQYVSEDTDVATVNAQGIVNPVAPGKTTITITYDNLKKVIPVIVRQDQ